MTRPNILLVAFDSLSAKTLAAYQDSLPALRNLREASVFFANAYATSPESSPARASLFTGLDIAAHGLWTDGVALPERETTLPAHFAGHGYRTSLVGRRQLAGVSNWTTEHAIPGEFHQFDWAQGPLHRSRQNAYLIWLQEEASETYSAIFPAQPNPDDTDIPAGQRAAIAELPDELSFNAWVGERICQQFSQPAKQPFFSIASLVVGVDMGAEPINVADAINERALIQADAALGKMLGTLPEDTILVVTSARGAMSDPAAPQLAEPAIKVPLMIRAGNGMARQDERLVSTMDIAPTLYEIAGIKSPQRIQGRSFMNDSPRGWALVRTRNPGRDPQTALVTDRWKLVMLHGNPDAALAPVYHLYDLTNDPDEARDLSASPKHQGELEDMIDQMIDARVALEDRTEPRIASF